MYEAIVWRNGNEWAAMRFRMLHIVVFPFFWLLNWNDNNKCQITEFSFSNLVMIFKTFLRHWRQCVLECIKFYFSKIKHLRLYYSLQYLPTKKGNCYIVHGLLHVGSLWRIFYCGLIVMCWHTVDLSCISALKMNTVKLSGTVKCSKKYGLYQHCITIRK
jgi:hypothetical protein